MGATDIILIESNGHSVSFGRMDQWLYPFYNKDIESGRLTKDEIQELLDVTFLKPSQYCKLRDRLTVIANAGRGWGGESLTIGGVDENGQDATNDLHYTLEHPGEADLIFKQFEVLLAHFLNIIKTSASEQRTDSTFVTPNIRRAGRLSLAYDVLVQAIKSIPELLRTERLNKVLEPGYKTDLLFRTKGAEVASRLQEMLDLIHELLKIACSHSKLKELEEIKVAERFLKEQAYYDYREDSYTARSSKDIEATSLQSAYDQDATYRRKGSKQAVGYVLNITETCGDKNKTQFIPDYTLEANVASDQSMLEERLPEIK